MNVGNVTMYVILYRFRVYDKPTLYVIFGLYCKNVDIDAIGIMRKGEHRWNKELIAADSDI